MGVCLFGSNNTVRNVQVYNHVSPIYPGDSARQESFAILLTSGGDWECWGNLVENCYVSDFKGNYDGGIAIAGAAPVHGTIRNCRIKGGPAIDIYDFSGVMGAEVVEGCLIEDAAIGIYTEGMPRQSMTIRNCIFRRIRAAAMRINLYRDQDRLVFENNQIIDSTGIVVAFSTFNIGVLDIRANTFVGSGRWLDVNKMKGYLRVRDNIFSPGMDAKVVDTTGVIGSNSTVDGTKETKPGMIKPSNGKNQLKLKLN
jgi:hypothetical protein